MAFMRTFAATRNCLSGLRQIRTGGVFAANMSTQSYFVPPFGSQNKTGQTKKSGIMSAVSGLLASGGAVFLYKAYTDDKFSFGSKFNWIFPQASCAEKEKQDSCGKCEDSSCLHSLDKEEQTIIKANQELEKVLLDVKPKAMQATEVALKAYCEATEVMKLYIDKAYTAIEMDHLESPKYEELWCDVYDLAVKRCEKVRDAMTKGKCAWELICRLREVVQNGKACKYTSCNPLLIVAESTLLCAERELTNAKNRMECVKSDSCMVEQYRGVIEDFRQELKVEAGSSSQCKCEGLTNECAQIIPIAHQKVVRRHREMAQTLICTGRVPEKHRATQC